MHSLLQRMERREPLRLRQPEILAPVNDELRRGPLVHVVGRAVEAREALALRFPGTSSPFVVELYAWQVSNSVWHSRVGWKGKGGLTKKSSSVEYPL